MPIPVRAILEIIKSYKKTKIASILAASLAIRKPIKMAAEILGNNFKDDQIKNITTVLGVCAPCPPTHFIPSCLQTQSYHFG